MNPVGRARARPATDAHHVPGVRHEEVLSHMSRQQVEENPLVVQLHLLHVIPLLLRLDAHTQDDEEESNIKL